MKSAWCTVTRSPRCPSAVNSVRRPVSSPTVTSTMPEASTPSGMTYSISFWMVAAVPSGCVVALDRTSSCVPSVAAALMISRMTSRIRVEDGSPPSRVMTEDGSWNDAARGALNTFACAALHVSVRVKV